MAAQYTEVTLDDMEKFLKRGFRALRPKQGVQGSEYFYDLALSPNVAIRVMTSVKRSSGSGAGVGEDAIRLLLWGTGVKHPLIKGSNATIVKRTQGWRNSLQNRVEDLMETYDDRQDYWESRGSGESAPAPAPASPSAPAAPYQRPPTDKMVNYVKLMVTRGGSRTHAVLERFNVPLPFSETSIRAMSGTKVSLLIDELKSAIGWGDRYSYDFRDDSVD